MDDFNEEEWELIAQMKEKKIEIDKKEVARLNHLRTLPIHKRLLEVGEEEHLKTFKATLAFVFKKKGKGKFEDYWKAFLDTGITINKFNGKR